MTFPSYARMNHLTAAVNLCPALLPTFPVTLLSLEQSGCGISFPERSSDVCLNHLLHLHRWGAHCATHFFFFSFFYRQFALPASDGRVRLFKSQLDSLYLRVVPNFLWVISSSRLVPPRESPAPLLKVLESRSAASGPRKVE